MREVIGEHVKFLAGQCDLVSLDRHLPASFIQRDIAIREDVFVFFSDALLQMPLDADGQLPRRERLSHIIIHAGLKCLCQIIHPVFCR